jgi:Amt family ammonium transporter
VGVLASLVVPQAALADVIDTESGVLVDGAAINTLWVMVAAFFVMFMQAGFMLLEIGFSRGKNAGTVVPKILINFSIAALMWWACGFAFAFGPGEIIGDTGFFLQNFGDPADAFPVMAFSDATVEAKWFFQFVFCAVSLAIVWGTTLERIKFGVYIIYAIVFAGLIYPIGAHWVFGGGWLQANVGMQDFAGSTAVHLIGATGGLAVLLLLGARKGKYGADGKPRPIPGHNMPMFGLGVLILWLGWFGFNRARRWARSMGASPRSSCHAARLRVRGCSRRPRQPAQIAEDARHRHGRKRRDCGPGRDHAPPATSSTGPPRSSARSLVRSWSWPFRPSTS